MSACPTNRTRPVDWPARWIGHAAPDCAHLAREIMAGEFGIDVALPATPDGLHARDRAVSAGLTGDIARPLREGERPQDGDGVLLRAAGRVHPVGHHIGIYVATPDPGCLHWRAGLGATLHPLRDMGRRGMEVVGLYRWSVCDD